MKKLILLFIPLLSCTAQIKESDKVDVQVETEELKPLANKDSLEMEAFYAKNIDLEANSSSIGTVSNGQLKNGEIMPFFGSNFTYFDRDSYLASRAFTNSAVKTIILDAYKMLNSEYPQRKFYLMELSNREGGKLYPHRTHQNGLSVDFMMPMIKNGEPNYALDTLGKQHYFLKFNDNGEYVQDTTIKVDFDLIAKHILLLNEMAENNGYSIEKVIIKIEYKDNLFNTSNGRLLQKSGIYIVKKLSPLINSFHDEHFHIDFKKKHG